MTKGKNRSARLEFIIWSDAWFGYDNPVEPKDIVPNKYLASSGFLVREDRKEVVLAMQLAAEDDDTRVRHVTGIPKKSILSRRSYSVRVPDVRKEQKR